MQAEQEAAEAASLPKVPRAEVTKDEQLGEELPAVPQVRTLLLWKNAPAYMRMPPYTHHRLLAISFLLYDPELPALSQLLHC